MLSVRKSIQLQAEELWISFAFLLVYVSLIEKKTVFLYYLPSYCD